MEEISESSTASGEDFSSFSLSAYMRTDGLPSFYDIGVVVMVIQLGVSVIYHLAGS